jgi:hypothetical protein
MTEPTRRSDPPAQLAKIATAGATGMFVFGLAAVMGWADRTADEPAIVPAAPPATTATAQPTTVVPSTTLLPLATTIPVAPAPVPVPAPAPVPAPPPVAVAAPPPASAPPAPVIVVSEQSQ